jgi:hypothetical protein
VSNDFVPYTENPSVNLVVKGKKTLFRFVAAEQSTHVEEQFLWKLQLTAWAAIV